MHELAITQGIVNFALEEAAKRNAAKVTALTVAVGALSGIVPDCIETYFALVAEGTPAEGAKLTFRRIPATVRCPDCNAESKLPDFRLRCPACTSRKVELLSGREAYIESMEIEEKN
ncbi:MAG: hydrogenase maturation nickel metallochaperone HypA [Clostridia bacterium]|nr:hydrogenase maturation nickel metallochaperone HypA [Clostridia bacterium]